MHELRNPLFPERPPPPLINTVIIWPYEIYYNHFALCNIVVIWTYHSKMIFNQIFMHGKEIGFFCQNCKDEILSVLPQESWQKVVADFVGKMLWVLWVRSPSP